MTRSANPGILRWVVSVFVCLLVANHLLMTASYLSPPNLLRLSLQDASNKYMPALFSQNWHMFSPDPGITSTKLAVRCKDKVSAWGPWEDPTEQLYRKYYHNRMSGCGKLLILYRYVAVSLYDAHQSIKAETLILRNYDISLMSIKKKSAIPTNGNSMVFVAELNGALHFRVFNRNGKRVINFSENKSFDNVHLIDLREIIEGVRNGKTLTKVDKDRAISAVSTYLGDHVFGLLKGSPVYQMAYAFTKRACTSNNPTGSLTEVQWKILDFYPVKYSESKNLQKRWSHVNEIVFPPVGIHDDESHDE